MARPHWIIEPFDRQQHDRTSFDCGVPALNDWLATKVSQFERRDLARAYVLVEREQVAVRGYYAMSNHAVVYEALPEDQLKGVPRIDVPVVLIGRLAIDRSVQGAETRRVSACRCIATRGMLVPKNRHSGGRSRRDRRSARDASTRSMVFFRLKTILAICSCRSTRFAGSSCRRCKEKDSIPATAARFRRPRRRPSPATVRACRGRGRLPCCP